MFHFRVVPFRLPFSPDGHLGGFCVLTVVNSGAMKIGMCVSFRVMIFTRSQHHSSEMSGSHGPSMFRFLKKPRDVCLWLPLFPSPARVKEDSLSWTSQAAFILCTSLGWWLFWWVGGVGTSQRRFALIYQLVMWTIFLCAFVSHTVRVLLTC